MSCDPSTAGSFADPSSLTRLFASSPSSRAAAVPKVGVPLRSEYAPEVATVASVGVPLRSEYAPEVATVASPAT